MRLHKLHTNISNITHKLCTSRPRIEYIFIYHTQLRLSLNLTAHFNVKRFVFDFQFFMCFFFLQLCSFFLGRACICSVVLYADIHQKHNPYRFVNFCCLQYFYFQNQQRNKKILSWKNEQILLNILVQQLDMYAKQMLK